MDWTEKIKEQVTSHPVVIYMKGTPEQPECGFSAAAVASLKSTGLPFSYVNVLASPRIREQLPRFSQWPTFPQIFIRGELIGGSDIVVDMAKNGSLKSNMEAAIGPVNAS